MFGNWKLVGVCLGFGILILGFFLTGCGERIESTSYYYSPSWTKDGQIIFTYGLQSVRKDTIGTQLSSSYTETVMTMSSTGTNLSPLFDVMDAPPYSPSCSPNRYYVAYLGDLRDNQFGKIVIRSISTEAYTGMRKVELLFGPTRIISFDWSSDGDKIVYCTTQEVRVRDWNDYIGTTDTLVTAESDLKFVSWKYGGRIAFVHGSPETLSLIYPDGTGRINLSAAASVDKPQISSLRTNEVYGIAGGSYCKVDVSGGTPATVEVFANFKGELPRISSDGSKVVYDKVGEDSGIYVLDLSTIPAVETKLK